MEQQIISEFVEAEGIKIHYYCGGEGQPAVIIPGFGANAQTLLGLLDNFKKDFKVYIIDLPGFGQSEPLRQSGDYLQGTAKVVAKTIANLKLRDYLLAGFSMGGTLIVNQLSEYEKHSRAYILIEPYAGSEYLKYSAGIKRGLSWAIKIFTGTIPLSWGKKIWRSDRVLLVINRLISPIQENRSVDQKLAILRCAEYQTFWKCLKSIFALPQLAVTTQSSKQAIIFISPLSDTMKYQETITAYRQIWPNLKVVDLHESQHYPTEPIDQKYFQTHYPELSIKKLLEL